MKQGSVAAIFLGAAMAWAPCARGEDLHIEYTPTGNNIIYGCPVTYSVAGDWPGPIASYTWEYQKPCDGQWSPLTVANTTPTQAAREIYPGTFNVRCKLTFHPGSGGTKPDDRTLTTTITIPPPDAVKIIGGQDEAAPGGTRISAQFALYCKGKPCCYVAQGSWVQEKLTNSFTLGRPDRNLNSNWIGHSGSMKLYLNGASIVDSRLFVPNARWYNLPPGKFSQVNQQFRIFIPDPCLEAWQTYVLSPVITMEIIKNANGTYQYHNIVPE